ncbi:hypothetical protein DIPPA_19365 [Diplonema papillatum]|nr:hypothetical protein DIPPA_19365 [Diplonema papillatum]
MLSRDGMGRDTEAEKAYKRGMKEVEKVSALSTMPDEEAPAEDVATWDIPVTKRWQAEPMHWKLDGNRIVSVDPGPAERSGLQTGDRITEVNGVPKTTSIEIEETVSKSVVLTCTVMRARADIEDNNELDMAEKGSTPSGQHAQASRQKAHGENGQPQSRRRGRRPAAGSWGTQRQSMIRAVITALLAFVALLLTTLSDEDDGCPRDLTTLMVLNTIVLFLLAFLIFFMSKLCMRYCELMYTDDFPRQGALLVSAISGLWGILFVIVQTTYLRKSTRDACGTAFGAGVAMVCIEFVFCVVLLMLFCSTYTNIGDDEDDALTYRMYSPPPPPLLTGNRFRG